MHRLVVIARECVDTGATTHDGKALYRHPAWPNARFVVARAASSEDHPTLVTVMRAALPPKACKRERGPRRDDDG